MTNKAALYQELAPLLDHPLPREKDGRIWSYCVAHADGTKHKRSGRDGAGRSLSLHPMYGLECFAGCQFQQIVDGLYAGSGRQNPAKQPGGLAVNRGDELTEKRRSNSSKLGTDWKLVAEYAYSNFEGVLAYKGRFHRFDDTFDKGYDKQFRWRLPEGEWSNGISSKYKMSELPLWGMECVVPGERVWFAEGEEAVNAIRARNQVAVCAPGSASGSDFGTALECLRECEVILWPDNDVPGRDYMARVRERLRGIADNVVTVNAPVPPKGDAVEYFAAGGTIDALLASLITKPTCDVLAHNHFLVRVPREFGPIAFEFQNMNRASQAIPCELTVTDLAPAGEPEPYSLRINLLSASARAELARELAKQFPGDSKSWTTTISSAYSRAISAFSNVTKAVPFAELPEREQPEWLLQDILPEGVPSILFGDGSSGKTYLAYSMGLAIALGDYWCGNVTKHGRVLIVDYETDGGEARFRMRRLLEGLGLDAMTLPYLPIDFWAADGAPFPDIADSVAKHVRENDVKLVIIDSGADACGGEPTLPAAALGYFNGLSKLHTTTLTIAHITKSDEPSASLRPFGTVFWHNRARRTWFVKREQEEDTDEIDVAMFCRKANSGRKPSPQAFKVKFVGENGPVHVDTQDFRKAVVFESDHSAGDQVEKLLIEAGTALTIKQIMDMAGPRFSYDAVKKALERGRGSRFVQVNGGPGRPMAWGVLAA